MAQDYDSCKFHLQRAVGGSLLGWTFQLGKSRLSATGQTFQEVPVSAASVTPSVFDVDTDGALSLTPAIGAASMSFHSPSAQLSPPMVYRDVIQILYGGAIVMQGVISLVGVSVELSDGETGGWDHDYSWTIQDITAGMLGHGPGIISVPVENPIQRLTRIGFVVDTTLLTLEQLNYINSLRHEEQNDVDQTYLAWARQFTELTEVPVRITPSPMPVWNSLQILPHPVAWDGVPPVPDITTPPDCDWLNTLEHEQSADTDAKMVPKSVQVPANETRFLSGFEHITIPPVPLGTFRLGVDRLGSSGDVPLGVSAGAVVDIYGAVMAVTRLTHVFAHHKLVTSMELAQPIVVNI